MRKIRSFLAAFFAAFVAAIAVAFVAAFRPVWTVVSVQIRKAQTAFHAAIIVAMSGYRIAPRSALWMAHPQRGAITPQSVVMLMVVGLLAAILVPLAIDQFVAASIGSWSTTSQTIWNNLPTIILVALLLGFVTFFLFGTEAGRSMTRRRR